MIRKVFPILALAAFSSMLGMGIVVPLLPVYATSMGASGLVLGMIFSSFPLTRGLLTPFAGRLSDRRGRKKFICIGLLAYAIVSLGYVWSASTSQLILVRLIHGASSAVIIPIAQAYIGETAPPEHVGKWMGYFNTAFISGYGVGPLMGGILNDHFGMDSAFYTMGALNLLAFFIALLFLPEIRTTGSANSAFSFGAIARSNMMRALFGFRLSFDAGLATLFTFLPLFAATVLSANSTQTGILLTAFILLMSLSQAYSGRLADKFNRSKLVITGGVLSVCFFALLPASNSFGQLLGIMVVGSLGASIAMPATSALAVDEGRKFGMGVSMAVFYMAISLGGVIGPTLSGLARDISDLNAVFYVASGLGVIGTGVFARLTRKR